jgi:S-methylmethionine-dependent homocysteine/selenocysteine methylase
MPRFLPAPSHAFQPVAREFRTIQGLPKELKRVSPDDGVPFDAPRARRAPGDDMKNASAVLPEGRLFMTDGGLETTLIFHDGLDLPYFAAFDLLKDEAGTDYLRSYYRRYAEMASGLGLGLVLESPTWRASRDWADKLGYDAARLAAANRKAVALMHEIRDAYRSPRTPIVVSGNVGPRGDGYRVERRMNAHEARAYHGEQIATFATCGVDLVSAFTMNYVDEAVGVVLAARAVDLPAVISFTLETDGRLPDGATLKGAIEATDAATGAWPSHYMINCAHPTHFASVLEAGAAWMRRIGGVRANASRRSHAELDAAPDLDAGDPEELGGEYRQLRPLLPGLAVVGGCCGTDHRHVASICAALARPGAAETRRAA